MERREWKAKVDPEEVADVDLRKSIFREMANDFFWSLKHGAITDRPGSVARMMEQAFKAGALAAKADETFDSKDRLRRPMTEMDVPSLARDALRWFKLALEGGWNHHNIYQPAESLAIGREPFRPEGIVLFMRPKIPGLPSTMTRDQWYLSLPYGRHDLSNKVVGPLAKLGLVKISDLSGGFRMAVLTEWGFDLLVTGRTAFPADRQDCDSSTFETYGKLFQGENPAQLAAKALGMMKEEEEEEDASPAPRLGR
jgi:hypothetical protein